MKPGIVEVLAQSIFFCIVALINSIIMSFEVSEQESRYFIIDPQLKTTIWDLPNSTQLVPVAPIKNYNTTFI